MSRIDQRRVSSLCFVVPFAGSSLAGRVLGGGNQLESPTFQFLVNLLPDRRIKAASSPGSPAQQ